MTWDELHGVLRDRGPDRDRCARAASAGARVGDRHRVRLARAWQPDTCSSRSRGSTPTARRSRGRRSTRGAAAIVSDRQPPGGMPRAVGDRRGRAARRWRSAGRGASTGNPSREMQVVGITGTNGKTHDRVSRRRDLRRRRHPLQASSAPSATASATRCAKRRGPRRKRPTCRRCLREMVDRRCGACAMEVSSHALSLRRVRRHHLRGGRLHEPHARSSRLPRRHGRRTSARSGGCSRCCRATRPA